MRTLLIDNRDSYTYNLFQLIAAVTGEEPEVWLNDDPALATAPLDRFGRIVISPGPGHPARRGDIGLLADLLGRTDLPVLGVCLGHQALARLAGGRVVPAPEPRHGYLERVKHEDDELFAGIPTEFTAVRYHSLCVAEPLPPSLAAIARSDDGVIMALRHRHLPRWGVQFHPESVRTEHGARLIANFCGTYRHRPARPRRRRSAPPPTLSVAVETLGHAIDPEAAFAALYADSADCFWLDSSRLIPGLSRFSFLGDAAGPLSEVLTYRVGGDVVSARTGEVEPGTAFDVLARRLAERRVADAGLPFDFTGGYVGWFGYEMKGDCGATPGHPADTPDAAWIFADRLIAVDHERDETYLLAVHDNDPAAAHAWLSATGAALGALPTLPPVPPVPPAEPPDPEPYLVRDRSRYLADIAECQRDLRRGETYEINLTNAVRVPYDGDGFAYYRRLRRANPAPYGALLRIAGVTVLGSSPELFLRIGPDGTVEARPIKGTAPRGDTPAQDARIAAALAADPKSRAENLMIVDLLRNDLGRVCHIGTVTVDRYQAVETYQTMHQMVSTISGTLRVEAVECVRRCFPGGSMTGAPKLRTMELIDRLEDQARGIYSGTLGWFGLTGAADLSIVIRTAVQHAGMLHIGAGGAIVLDSDPVAEYDEMLLKARSALTALPAPGTR